MAEPTTTAGAVFKAIEAILPGAIGAAVSLRFIPGTIWQKVSSYFSGLACAYYLGNGLIDYLTVAPGGLMAEFIKFTAGLFGLAIVSHGMQQIPELLAAIRRRYIGGDGDAS